MLCNNTEERWDGGGGRLCLLCFILPLWSLFTNSRSWLHSSLLLDQIPLHGDIQRHHYKKVFSGMGTITEEDDALSGESFAENAFLRNS